MRWKQVALCTLATFGLVSLLAAPPAVALWAGINIDVHQDNLDVIANDFHVEGRIESGNPGGNWGNPPVLLEHVDDLFPDFSYSITPDPDPIRGELVLLHRGLVWCRLPLLQYPASWSALRRRGR